MNMNKISSVQSKTDIEIVYLFTFREGFLVCPINIFMMFDLRCILYGQHGDLHGDWPP